MAIFDFLKTIFIPVDQNPNFNKDMKAEPPQGPKMPQTVETVRLDPITLPTAADCPQSPVASPLISSPLRLLGEAVVKYESGTKGAAAISTGQGDPGGVSYGKYQFASKTGTVQDFIKRSGYASKFVGLAPATIAFNVKWLELANDPLFVAAQWSYIYETHYSPVREYCDRQTILSSRAVNEALWSMSVQHGKTAQIVNLAGVQKLTNENDIIDRLYQARRVYVKNLSTLSQALKAALMRRYDAEIQDVKKLIGVQ